MGTPDGKNKDIILHVRWELDVKFTHYFPYSLKEGGYLTRMSKNWQTMQVIDLDFSHYKYHIQC
jgi:hypothetical protein